MRIRYICTVSRLAGLSTEHMDVLAGEKESRVRKTVAGLSGNRKNAGPASLKNGRKNRELRLTRVSECSMITLLYLRMFSGEQRIIEYGFSEYMADAVCF